MPFEKGHKLNHNAGEGKKAVNKIMRAINSAIERVKDDQVVGMDALINKIAKALSDDTVSTLKALAPLLPKNISVETYTGKAETLSDDDLAELIAKNTVILAQKERDATEQPHKKPHSIQ